MVQIEQIPQLVAMDQQGLLIGSPILQEKLPLEPSLIRQVDFESERKIEIHDIDSDIEEETRNPTCLVKIVTSMTSSVSLSQFSGDIFYPLFS